MHKQINNLLQLLFRIKIQRIPKIYFPKNKLSNTKPLYIEFVGVSGVGKSTIFNVANRKQNWISLKSFVSVSTHLIKSNKLTYKLYNAEVYQKITEYKLISVNASYKKQTGKLELLSYLNKVLREDATIKFFNSNHTIVSDEGICHNFSDSIEKLIKINTEYVKEFFNNRAIIYCYSTPEAIAEQFLKRRKKMKIVVPQDLAKTKRQILDELTLALETKRNFIDLLQTHNVPVLKINTSNNLHENAHKVNQFIKNLQNEQ